MIRFPSSLRRAFSLVEILVVIAIIMLLAAILFPVFGRARESARTATCANNLRQIGMGLRLYLSDSRNVYPTGAVMGQATCSWTHNLAPYLKTTSIFNCPSNSIEIYQDGCVPDRIVDGNTLTSHFDGGYILNAPNGSFTTYFNDNSIRRPAQMILVVDGINPLGITRPVPGQGPMTDGSLLQMGIDLRHNNAINALFSDGHVKRETSASLLDRSQWTMSGTDVQPTPPPFVFPPPPTP